MASSAWWRAYTRVDLPRDLSAGVTVGVLLVPQALAYAALAGLPPITGLYAALASLVIYAFVGSSSHLSYGPVALIALLTAAGVGPLAEGDAGRFALLAATLAILVGVIHVILGILRAGAVVDLIAHPVIVGFTAASGLIIGLTQARDLLGADITRSERTVDAIVAIVDGLPTLHPLTFAIGAVAVAALLLLRRIRLAVPPAFLVVVIGILLTVVLGLEDRGVRVVGTIPAGLPRPSLPLVAIEELLALLPPAGVIALVSFAESIAIGKSIAGRTRETLHSNRELVASGTANIAAGVFGGFPVAGSFTRSFLTFTSRGRTQMSGLVAALLVALTLTLLTPALEPLPRPVLAAIVIVTVIGLVDITEARRVARVDTRDGVVLVVTFAATLLLGIEPGLAVGVVVNLVAHVLGGMQPELVVLGRIPGTSEYRNIERQAGIAPKDGLILRLDGPLDFLSARAFGTRVRRLVAARPEVRWIVLNCAAMTRLDSTGLHVLTDLQEQMSEAGIDLRFATMRAPIRGIITRAGLADELLVGTAHGTIVEALRAIGLPEQHPLCAPATEERRPEVWF
jgi:sulfate permease, SulP family